MLPPVTGSNPSSARTSLIVLNAAAFKTINEVRAEEGLDPVTGGSTPYLQQQNYSLEALSKRDAKDDPFSKSEKNPKSDEIEDIEKALIEGLIEGFKLNG